MNTKKEIVDKTFYILWEDQSSTVFDKEGAVVPKINTTIDQICRCNVTNILTWQKLRGGILDFLYTEKTLKIPRVKKNLEELDVNSTYILLDSIDWLPEKWYMEIDWNIISYDWVSEDNNAILKVNWVNGYHAENSSLHFAYLLPMNILKASDFYDVEYKEMLKFVDFREERLCFERCYTIKPFKWRKVAVFYNIDNQPIQISYTKKLEPMESDDDECWLPDDYGVKIVPYLVAWALLIDTSEVAKWEKLLQIWYSELEDMYSYYATPTKQFRKKIKTTPLNNNLR